MVIHGNTWCNMVQHGSVWYNMKTALYNIVLHGTTWYCMVLHGTAWYTEDFTWICKQKSEKMDDLTTGTTKLLN